MDLSAVRLERVFAMYRIAAVLLSALPSIAQHPAQHGDPSSPKRVALTHGCGLRSGSAPGRPTALLGGSAAYRVRFSADGMRFEPALGAAVDTARHVSLALHSVRRGALRVVEPAPAAAPSRHGATAVWQRGAHVRERFEVTPAHVALSWVFDEPLPGAGDLVVRYALSTNLPAPTRTADGGLAFLHDGRHGVSIGGVTGIDARGARVAGRLRCEPGMLELSLPAAFVDAAAWPLVLDPLIGTAFDVQNSPLSDQEPDVGYDAATDRFLVVWRRIVSAADSDVLGQLVTSAGALVGPTLFLPSDGIVADVSVANLPSRGRFGVAWSQRVGSLRTVEFVGLDPATFLVTHTHEVASSTAATLNYVDLGSDLSASIGADRGFVVVWEDEEIDAIRARRIWFDANDQLVSPAAFSVFSDSSGTFASTYQEPEISRAARDDGWLMVVARRFSGLGPFRSISCRLVHTGAAGLGPTTSLGGTASNLVDQPDVDGFAGKWTVAWRNYAPGGSDTVVKRRPVQLASNGTSLSLGAEHTISGVPTSNYRFPTLAHTPGRTWLAYSWNSGSLFQPSELRVAGVDTGTGAACETVVLVSQVAVLDVPIAVATQSAGGRTDGEVALAVYARNGDVFGQLLRNHGTGGSYLSLGGGCGAGGAQSFSHPPGIGSSGLVCSVSGLSPTALLAVFNFGPPAPLPFQCQPCVVNPLVVPLTTSIAAGGASVEFPIPCLNSLVGQQFETQWTSIDFAQAPCGLLPALAFSERVRIVIGN